MSASPPSEHPPWMINAPTGGALPLPPVRDMLAHRQIAWFLALRDVRLRYKQTLLGVAWTVLQPLLGVGLFSVIFGELVGVPSDGVPYAVFVFAGLMGWTYLSGSLASSAMSLLANEELVTKISFPRLLAPLSGVIPGVLDFVVAAPILVVLVLATGASGPGLALLTVPLWLVLLAMLAFGLGCLLSALMVTYRDVAHGVPYFLQLWLFASPIVYPSSLATGDVGWLYYLNPAVAPIDGLRWALIGTDAPGARDALSLAVGLGVAIAGILYFSRAERRFADVI